MITCTGLVPDHTQAWNFIQYFREARPDAVSFPGYFKNAGYLTLGAGKLYHTDNPPDHDVPKSWSPGKPPLPLPLHPPRPQVSEDVSERLLVIAETTSDLAGLGPQTPGGTQSECEIHHHFVA